jgi:hypothetical protein
MPASRGVSGMSETHVEMKVQAEAAHADVRLAAMNRMTINRSTAEIVTVPEGRRTLVALLSASVISLVVWGLVVVLNVR